MIEIYPVAFFIKRSQSKAEQLDKVNEWRTRANELGEKTDAIDGYGPIRRLRRLRLQIIASHLDAAADFLERD